MAYISVSKVKPGMVLNGDVNNEGYRLPLATAGMILTEELIKRITNQGVLMVNICHSKENAKKVIHETTEALREVFDNLNFVAPKDFNRLLPCVNKIVALINESGQEIIDELFLIWDIDQYTLHHSIGTSFYSALLAYQIGFSEKQVKDLALGAILHDIGKGVISEEILKKPGMLDEDEVLEMQKHSALGYEILTRASEFSEEIRLIPLQHHERLDGTGYPNQLLGDDIHLYAKIVSIADSFSALTSDRVYRNKVSKFVAAEYLQGAAGSGFDPYLVNVFLYALFGNLTDSWVELSNGEVALVKSLNYKKPMRPKVAVYYGGNFVKEIDLAQDNRLYIKDFHKKEQMENQKEE